MATASSPSQQLYLDAFQGVENRLAGQARPWLRELRHAALSRFAADGFPGPANEAWKYTSVRPIEQAGFGPAVSAGRPLAPPDLTPFWFKGLGAYRLIFVDGFFCAPLAPGDPLPEGVTAVSLAGALNHGDERLRTAIHRGLRDDDAQGFAALNTAFLSDGLYLHLGHNVVLDQPIHIVFVTTEQGAERTLQPRNVIVAEPGSQATIIEHYVSLGELRYFTNTVSEVRVAENAHLEHYRVQQESPRAFHVSGLHVDVERNARYTSHQIDLGGALVRNDLRSRLNGEGAECHINGLYLVDGRRHIDNHTQIDHLVPRASSDEYYKGVIDDRGRAVFHGRIVVHPDAQHTDARQTNNNLLLSPHAEVDTKPQLEIYADDVRCAHGATVGQLDEEALFYLRSRAVDERTARELLTYAFANDVLERVRLDPLRRTLEARLGAQLLHGELGRPVNG